MPYLVIEVPPPTNDCFVALPYSSQFDDLFNAIEEAAKGAGLDEAIRIDRKEDGVKIPEEVERRIRSAKVVVAVCSPEMPGGKSNPNVMYELGLAHALGKPTVILAESIGSVPADVRDQFVFEYGKIKNVHTELVKEVQKKIKLRLKAMVSALINPGFRHITVASRRQQVLLNPEFWKHLSDIFRRVRGLRGEMQRMIPEVLELLETAQGMLSSDSDEVRTAFDKQWTRFDNSYQNVTQASFREWVEGGDIALSLDFLSGCTGGAVASQIDDARSFYNSIKVDLREYMPAHNQLRRLLAGMLLVGLNDRDKLRDIWGQIGALRNSTNTIFHQTDAIIYNLVEASIKIGELAK
jgi:nucleoside 2-deoxyribosyltransferase